MTGATATRPKKGLLSRFKKKNKKDTLAKPEQPTPPPSPEPQDEPKSKPKKSFTKKGVPVVTGDNPDDFNPSDVRKTTPGEPAVSSKSMKKSTKKSMKKSKKGPRPNSIVLDKAPTARESAFGGPPRYDWIDIVRTFVALAWRRHCHFSWRFWAVIWSVGEILNRFLLSDDMSLRQKVPK